MFEFRTMAKTAMAAVLGLTALTQQAAAEDKLTAVHAFPPFLVYTKTFLGLVDAINERGKGVVSIEVRGGPEAIGMFQQPAAVRAARPLRRARGEAAGGGRARAQRLRRCAAVVGLRARGGRKGVCAARGPRPAAAHPSAAHDVREGQRSHLAEQR